MTRVNVGIPPSELCDQMLLAEYRELPRVFAVNPAGAPDMPTLGRGHVKWCATKPHSMALRFYSIVDEMRFRGFVANYPKPPTHGADSRWTVGQYKALPAFAAALRARIVERLGAMKRAPTWTNRTRPDWATGAPDAG